jgi:hypothetical protein
MGCCELYISISDPPSYIAVCGPGPTTYLESLFFAELAGAKGVLEDDGNSYSVGLSRAYWREKTSSGASKVDSSRSGDRTILCGADRGTGLRRMAEEVEYVDDADDAARDRLW